MHWPTRLGSYPRLSGLRQAAEARREPERIKVEARRGHDILLEQRQGLRIKAKEASHAREFIDALAKWRHATDEFVRSAMKIASISNEEADAIMDMFAPDLMDVARALARRTKLRQSG